MPYASESPSVLLPRQGAPPAPPERVKKPPRSLGWVKLSFSAARRELCKLQDQFVR